MLSGGSSIERDHAAVREPSLLCGRQDAHVRSAGARKRRDQLLAVRRLSAGRRDDDLDARAAEPARGSRLLARRAADRLEPIGWNHPALLDELTKPERNALSVHDRQAARIHARDE